MNITVFGANSLVGRQLVLHALTKGWHVNAFDRDVTKLIDRENDNFTPVKGYLFSKDDIKDVLKKCDGVLCALGVAADGVDKSRSVGLDNIIHQMQANGIKNVMVLGGFGVLLDEEGIPYMDDEEFPAEWQLISQEHLSALQKLKNSGLNWTFVCPKEIFKADADNHFVTAENHLPKENATSSGNIALYMVEHLFEDTVNEKVIGIANN
ncbi:NAD(P)-dependent oxidoreductase [Polluticaenibacter yanchengensis]|uniref:NAD(P)H-binding protein n=1 Tax=Polluticaenibacter yanchengensis TaxID=3014562 RepID=A0ABT4UPI1_9BACT|nr:NAD(P)H-binding protein [Chitinophagaceae bacterium LY-5]